MSQKELVRQPWWRIFNQGWLGRAVVRFILGFDFRNYFGFKPHRFLSQPQFENEQKAVKETFRQMYRALAASIEAKDAAEAKVGKPIDKDNQAYRERLEDCQKEVDRHFRWLWRAFDLAIYFGYLEPISKRTLPKLVERTY